MSTFSDLFSSGLQFTRAYLPSPDYDALSPPSPAASIPPSPTHSKAGGFGAVLRRRSSTSAGLKPRVHMLATAARNRSGSIGVGVGGQERGRISLNAASAASWLSRSQPRRIVRRTAPALPPPTVPLPAPPIPSSPDISSPYYRRKWKENVAVSSTSLRIEEPQEGSFLLGPAFTRTLLKAMRTPPPDSRVEV